MFYLIANWKANKNLKESILWVEYFKKYYKASPNISVIICPPFPLIYLLKEKLKKLTNVFIGSQDLSIYEEGNFTGEVTAKTLKDLVDFTIVGHSERKKFFGEEEKIIEKKINLALKYKIEPILCIRDEKDKIFPPVKFIAYEPLSAIGTGKNQSPNKVIAIKKLLNLSGEKFFIYGGSLNKKNITLYLAKKEIAGFLVGSASLKGIEFLEIFNKLKKK